MTTNSYRFFPAVSDLSTLKLGASVWIIKEGLSGKYAAAPTRRFFVGAFPESTGHALLSENGATLEKPIIHTGPIWTRRAGVLEELLEQARRRHFSAAAEVQRLEWEVVECMD